VAIISNKLQSKFARPNRYANFGAVINRIDITGFRGIDASIEFASPVTVLTGLNGAGKSTIGQLALCAYKMPSTAKLAKRYYVRDFFPFSAADPTPFTNTAATKYHYQTDKPEEDQVVTISRVIKEWSSYKRQPERSCFYVGFTLYIPKVERRDMSIYSSAQIQLTEKRDFLPDANNISKILGCAYDNVYFQGIKHKEKTAELGIASRYGYQYSENNMGFGEGRVVYMVHLLETSPEQSLFVIEEPETSLHESAQYELASYFVDVADRRHHQMIITTHSSSIMDAVPPDGRKFIHRDKTGVKVFDGFSSNRVRAALSQGHSGRTIVCVEDKFAKTFVVEMLRQRDPSCLRAISFLAVGDKKAVTSAKKLFDKTGVKSIAIRDADVEPSEGERIYSLPGSMPPEKEVFSCPAVQARVEEELHVDFPALLATNAGLDHHDYVKRVAALSCSAEDHIRTCVIKWFLESKGKDWSKELVDKVVAQI
jgi:predicted ATPase